MDSQSPLFNRLKGLTTEQRNPASRNIDAESTPAVLRIINEEDKRVAIAVEKELPYVAEAVAIVTEALRLGGRLVYVGAGTSGRLGVLDAVECPPTFGVDPQMVQGLIAGGDKAMFRAQEAAEDKEESGAREIEAIHIGKKDVVCGIAASLQTPYVVGAIKRAKELGARTLYVTTNPRALLSLPEFVELGRAIDVAVCPEVGPEVIMGSTRMKSGTAQKLILNMISTASMIGLGKVYENMMIDLQLTNAKLRERAKKIIMTITGINYQEASDALESAGGQVKTALVMLKARVTRDEAQKRLHAANGFVRAAIEGKSTT